MNQALFDKLWLKHPFPKYPCDQGLFPNQCAIRLGIALDSADIHIRDGVRRCSNNYTKLKDHHPGHILSAQELANALAKNPALLGQTVKLSKKPGSIQNNLRNLAGKKGILFILNGWGSTDHIDLWNCSSLKGGDSSFLQVGEQIWFWQIA